MKHSKMYSKWRVMLFCLLLTASFCLQACNGKKPVDSNMTPTVAPTATLAPTATPEPTATEAPTATPAPTATLAPTATPEPTATPAPTATPEPTATLVPTTKPTGNEGIALDFLSRGSVFGQGVGTDNADGSVTYNNGQVNKCAFSFPSFVKSGDELDIKVKVKFGSSADTAVRFYLTDDARGNCSEIYVLENPGTDNTEFSFSLTATADASAIMFASSSFDTYFQDVTIYAIVVSGDIEAEAAPQKPQDSGDWVTTWGTAEQKCNMTGATDSAMPKMKLEGTTVRQIIRVTSEGTQIRFRLSNQYGESDVEVQSMHIAKQSKDALADGTGFGTAAVDMSTIITSTDMAVTVDGKTSFVIPKGKVILTDPIDFKVDALDNIAVSMYFGKTPTTNITGHRGARATTYQVSGNKVSEEVLTGYQTTTSWFFLADASVLLPGGKAVVCFGDSITDGYGTDASYLGHRPDSYTRWIDYLAKRLQENEETKHITLINEGIGSNSILGSYPTDSGRQRFSRDLLEHDNVAYCIILFGVNDMDKLTDTSKFNLLLPEYQRMVKLCHDNGIKVYGAPILPFGTSSYYSEASEQVRTMINDWMRSEDSQLDGIIDFEGALADPENPKNILKEYTFSDGLHPYEGYDVMADAVDLSLFQE